MWRYSFTARHRFTAAVTGAASISNPVPCNTSLAAAAATRLGSHSSTGSMSSCSTAAIDASAALFANVAVVARRSAHSSHTSRPGYSTLSGDEALRNQFEATDLMAEGESAGAASDDSEGGLQFTPDTQEMTAEEIRACVGRSEAWYSPSVYAWVAFASVDVIEVMMLHRALPTERTGKLVSRWFADPSLCLQQPRSLPELIGTERWAVVSPGLQELLTDYERVSPLVTTLRDYKLPLTLWLPLMRWVAALSTLNHATQSSNVAGLILGLANGHAPPQLGLPSGAARAECGAIVARVVMAAGAELGVLPLSLLGVSLLHLHGDKCRFRDQRLLMVASARAAARRLDWSVRTSGTIEQAAPKWVHEYLPSAMAQAAGGTFAEGTAATVGTVDAAANLSKNSISRTGDEEASTEDLLDEAEAMLASFSGPDAAQSEEPAAKASSRRRRGNAAANDDDEMVDASVVDMGAERDGGDDVEGKTSRKRRATVDNGAEDDDPFADHNDLPSAEAGATGVEEDEMATSGADDSRQDAESVASYFAPAERRHVMADEATRDVARASRRAALMQHLRS